jgi:hypothetical protein
MEKVMEKAEQAGEPPSCLLPPTFMIGCNSRGNWVAQEKSGTRGGLFVSRAEALKYARFESGNDPHAVVMVSGTLELDTSSATARADVRQGADRNRRQRRAGDRQNVWKGLAAR